PRPAPPPPRRGSTDAILRPHALARSHGRVTVSGWPDHVHGGASRSEVRVLPHYGAVASSGSLTHQLDRRTARATGRTAHDRLEPRGPGRDVRTPFRRLALGLDRHSRRHSGRKGHL